LLLISLGDGFLKKLTAPLSKAFQPFLLVRVQFGLDLGQGRVKSVATLLHRLDLDGLHLFDGGFYAWADFCALFRREPGDALNFLHQVFGPRVKASGRIWQRLSPQHRVSNDRPTEAARQK
jgi:hypothetical protein